MPVGKWDLLLVNLMESHSFREKAKDNICLIIQFFP
jgi:hypothetical protein